LAVKKTEDNSPKGTKFIKDGTFYKRKLIGNEQTFIEGKIAKE